MGKRLSRSRLNNEQFQHSKDVCVCGSGDREKYALKWLTKH